MKFFSNGCKNSAKMTEEFLEIPLEIKGREIVINISPVLQNDSEFGRLLNLFAMKITSIDLEAISGVRYKD